VGALALALAACSGGAAGGNPADEKVASQSSAMNPGGGSGGDPTGPWPFPGAMDRDGTRSCNAASGPLLPASAPGSATWFYPENYIAFPVLDTSHSDPYATAYSHYYSFAEAAPGGGSGVGQVLMSQFFPIPNANGYKYQVALLQGSSDTPDLVVSPRRWYLEGINRADQSWLLYPPNTTLPAPGQQPAAQPWCYASTGCAQGTAYLDLRSHPPDGNANAVGADWLALWNLTWMYSYSQDPYHLDPNQEPGWPASPASPTDSQNTYVESEHHECAFVYVCPGGTQACSQDADCGGNGMFCVTDYTHRKNCWAPCFNYDVNTGTLSVRSAEVSSLLPWDFFPAAERHDPGCCSF
jgi:hypothetical protein